MKKTNYKKSALLISGLAFALSLIGCTQNNTSAAVSPSPVSGAASESLVTTEGNAYITSTFDRAGIDVGISIIKPSAAEAQTEASLLIDKIYEALKNAGIDEKDINTENYYMSPEYDYSNEQSVLKGYRISQNLSVKNIMIDNLGSLLKAAGDSGATNINSIYFYFSNEDELYNSALEKAVEEARLKADVLAKTAGKEIKGIKTMVEGNMASFRTYSYNTNIRYASKEMAVDSYSIPTGDGKVSATVTVSFEMQ